MLPFFLPMSSSKSIKPFTVQGELAPRFCLIMSYSPLQSQFRPHFAWKYLLIFSPPFGLVGCPFSGLPHHLVHISLIAHLLVCWSLWLEETFCHDHSHVILSLKYQDLAQHLGHDGCSVSDEQIPTLWGVWRSNEIKDVKTNKITTTMSVITFYGYTVSMNFLQTHIICINDIITIVICAQAWA